MRSQPSASSLPSLRFIVPDLSAPFPRPFPEKAVPSGWKPAGLRLEGPLSERSEFRVFSSPAGFQGFCRTGPRFFAYFLIMQKVRSSSFLAKSGHCSATGNVSTFAKRCKSRQKNFAPMLRETRRNDAFLNRPKLALLKHRRFLTEVAVPPACGPSPSRNGAREYEVRNSET